MKTQNLFPTQVFHGPISAKSTIAKLNRLLLHDIKGLMKVDQEGWHWSKTNYVGGYTSYSSMANLQHRFPGFQELKKLVDRKVQSFAKDLQWDLMGGRLKMTTCWANVMPPLVQHSLHLHPLSVISGTYYVQIPKGSGDIKFEDPRLSMFMASPPRRSDAYFKLGPKPGTLALWESWLRHEVAANKGQGERISVSFNYEWV